MKALMITLFTSATLATGVASRPTTSLEAPSSNVISPEPAPYRVLSSKRIERIVQQGVVRQSGALSISVGNRARRTVSYESEQKFLPNGGFSRLKLVDGKSKARADFTLSEDGSKSTFAFGKQGNHSIDVNPDETLSFDGVTYSSEQELGAAMVQAGHIPSDEVELLASAIEIGNAELNAVNKGQKAKKTAGKVLGVLIEALKFIKKQLEK